MKFRKNYILGITIGLLILVINQIYIQQKIIVLEENASIINTAGYQRMMSQKIGLELRRHLNTPKLDDDNLVYDKLDSLTSIWSRNHEMIVTHQFTTEVINSKNLSSKTEEIRHLILQFIQLKNLGFSSQGSILKADKILDKFLINMDSFVGDLETYSNEQIQRLRFIELILFIFSIIVLILEFVFVFNPIRKNLSKLVIDLKYKNETLNNTNEKLFQQNTRLDGLNEDMKQFNHMATHDLKSPLNNMQGHFSLLKEDISQIAGIPESVNHSIKRLDLSMQELKLTLKDLDYITKEVSFSQQKDQIQLHDFSKQIIHQFKPIIDQNEILITTHFEDAPTLNFNRTALRSVLQNLISNSIKYRSKDRPSKIEITSKPGLDGIVLLFKDNGIGIDIEAHKDNLFGLFKQFSDQADGSGIGLYTIKRIINQMGGRIDLESKLDMGTTFVISLPKN